MLSSFDIFRHLTHRAHSLDGILQRYLSVTVGQTILQHAASYTLRREPFCHLVTLELYADAVVAAAGNHNNGLPCGLLLVGLVDVELGLRHQSDDIVFVLLLCRHSVGVWRR